MIRGLVFALLLLGAGFVGYRAAQTKSEPAETVQEMRPQPSVIVAIRKLARLEGATFHLQRVVDLKEKQSRLFGLVEAEDAILLVAAGEVIGGVDLSSMTESDVKVDWEHKRVELVLPSAEVFSVRVDNEHTYVHTRSTDLLAHHQVDLESQARQEAERGFRQAALDGQILSTAEMSVEKTVEALMRSLGFSDVAITFKGPIRAAE